MADCNIKFPVIITEKPQGRIAAKVWTLRGEGHLRSLLQRERGNGYDGADTLAGYIFWLARAGGGLEYVSVQPKPCEEVYSLPYVLNGYIFWMAITGIWFEFACLQGSKHWRLA